MKMNDFVVFILTHGRPNNITTYNTLKKCGYTGKIVFVIDNEDKNANKYYQNFGKENVIMFDKRKYADLIDEGNNFDERRTITHARNACFDIAKKLGYTYFIELDDDYTKFDFRINAKGEYPTTNFIIKNIDRVFKYLLSYYKTINAKSIAISQGGDWIGGGNNYNINWILKRKCMNSFICSTERPFKFVGAMNEDVNTYTTLGSRGSLFFTIPLVSLTQKQTQMQSGGITDMYLKFGTLAKSFTTVMMMPSSVKATYQKQMGRIHHYISWKNTVPVILNEKYKKQ